MNKMRLVYIITLPDIGGAQVHLYEVISKLPTSIEPYVILGRAGWLSEKLKTVTKNIYIVNELVRQIAPVKDIQAVYIIGKILKSVQPDLVHCHSSKAGFIGRIAAKLTGIPVVFTAHGWAFTEGVSSKKRKIYRLLETFVGYLSAKIICVSEYDRQLGLRSMSVHAHKLVTIYNGIDILTEHVEKQSSSILRLVMIARFSDPKDHVTLINALDLLIKSGIRFCVTFVGDGPNLAKIKKLVNQMNLNEYVNFLGQRIDIHEILCTHDIFLLISKWEGFPISILEAMREGMPVIASDVGGVREAVDEGKTGFLIPRNDANYLAEKLKCCYMHPELIQEMGLQGQKRFEAEFTSKIMMGKIMKVYQEILYKC